MVRINKDDAEPYLVAHVLRPGSSESLSRGCRGPWHGEYLPAEAKRADDFPVYLWMPVSLEPRAPHQVDEKFHDGVVGMVGSDGVGRSVLGAQFRLFIAQPSGAIHVFQWLPFALRVEPAPYPAARICTSVSSSSDSSALEVAVRGHRPAGRQVHRDHRIHALR